MGKIIKLNKKFSVTLEPIPLYNFDATIHKPSHFPSSDNEWEKGKYWITMIWKGKYLGLKLENKGTIIKPKIKLIIYSEKPLLKEFKGSFKIVILCELAPIELFIKSINES